MKPEKQYSLSNWDEWIIILKKSESISLEKLASAYRISTLRLLSFTLKPVKRGEAIKIYYDYLVKGICYIDALQNDGHYIDASRVVKKMLSDIDKSPVKLNKLFNDTHFLKDNTDFGIMEHGLV